MTAITGGCDDRHRPIKKGEAGRVASPFE